MTDTMIPNWMRILLLLLSGTSFVPQLARLFRHEQSSGISLYYVLFNLVSFTEQLTLGLALVADADTEFFLHHPLTIGDRLNIAQLAVAWLLSLAVFLGCLRYPSIHRDAPPRQVAAIYTAFLLVSLVPALVLLWTPPVDREEGRWVLALFHGAHSLLIQPAVTVAGLAAAGFQVRETRTHGAPGQALSLPGLLVQGVVFAVLAVSWAMRVVFPWSDLPEPGFGLQLFLPWYQLVGWAAVDNAVFSLVQIVTWHAAFRHVRGQELLDEMEPLMS